MRRMRGLKPLDRYDIGAFILILAAVAIRLLLLIVGWPPTDSDEATMGLMALHIAYQAAHPLIFYGQNYLGTLEAYAGALFFRLLGPSTFALRLGVLLFFLLFLWGIYLLVSRLYSKPLALFTLLLLGSGTGDILFRELDAVGGSPDVLLLSVALLLFTFWLVLSLPTEMFATQQSRRAVFFSLPRSRLRPLLYTLWSCLAGVALWSDPLTLPFIGMAALLIVLFSHRELNGVTLALMLAGFALGLSPQIIGMLTTPLTPTMLRLFSLTVQPAFSSPTNPPVLANTLTIAALAPLSEILQQVAGSLLVSTPVTLSGNSFCTLSSSQAWPLTNNPQVIGCTVVHGIWGVGYVALWFWATLLCVRELWHYRQTGYSLAKRQGALLQAARLMLLGGAGGTLLIYTLFPQAAITPWASSRYLVGLLISVPAVLYPLWRMLANRPRAGWSQWIAQAGAYVLLLIVSAAWIVGTVTALISAPQNTGRNVEQATLMQYLLQHHETRIYTDYWTCDMLAFRSDEKIVCSVLDEQLQVGLNRYPAYQAIVNAAPEPVYLFPLGSAQAQKWQTLKIVCQKTIYDNYIIYQPAQRVNLP